MVLLPGRASPFSLPRQVRLAPAEECESEMFITVPWEKRTLAVPLAQLEPIQADIATQQAVGDWHYWVEQGYEF